MEMKTTFEQFIEAEVKGRIVSGVKTGEGAEKYFKDTYRKI